MFLGHMRCEEAWCSSMWLSVEEMPFVLGRSGKALDLCPSEEGPFKLDIIVQGHAIVRKEGCRMGKFVHDLYEGMKRVLIKRHVLQGS